MATSSSGSSDKERGVLNESRSKACQDFGSLATTCLPGNQERIMLEVQREAAPRTDKWPLMAHEKLQLVDTMRTKKEISINWEHGAEGARLANAKSTTGHTGHITAWINSSIVARPPEWTSTPIASLFPPAPTLTARFVPFSIPHLPVPNSLPFARAHAHTTYRKRQEEKIQETSAQQAQSQSVTQPGQPPAGAGVAWREAVIVVHGASGPLGGHGEQKISIDRNANKAKSKNEEKRRKARRMRKKRSKAKKVTAGFKREERAPTFHLDPAFTL
ncbi:uncharacterized protein HMPREF1541_05138 [Cyphellophora europaea CBS 101466]|uniref:Uncharacterized protein n=1 Tax=Cyphellophora europaea (strain CBS 101466) TaxID=1220924 RepID=W2RYJ9_CYPE1|nr:uncharacterized protein HMPREF1541_05138 [Cyphellophora europaea CBS 101466]ETN40858.1 hypothetical protein HMPREF1541_05138 [Cyphellophora europaea CBS 101466]